MTFVTFALVVNLMALYNCIMQNHLKVATALAELLDNKYNLFGIRFGLDPILGLVPGFGDIVSLLLSLYIVWIGVQMKLPQHNITQMLGNVLLDFVLSLPPVVGDVADVVFKANIKNLEILRLNSNFKG